MTLDDDAYEAARTLSSATGKRLGKVVSDLIRSALRPGPGFSVRKGMPVFEVSEGAPLIPGGRAGELLDEEGSDG